MTETTAEIETVVVRALREDDLKAIVEIDAASSGRHRPEYFRTQSKVQISLVAEIDQRVVGFLIASLFYGEYGIAEPTASIDAVGVAPDVRRQRVGHALMQQLRSNLAALRVTTIRTEVAWTDFELLGFFRGEGFTPAPRLCLEASLTR